MVIPVIADTQTKLLPAAAISAAEIEDLTPHGRSVGGFFRSQMRSSLLRQETRL